MIEKIMQITTKTGINYRIGVSGKKEYQRKKKAIQSSKREFVEVIDTLEIKRSQIISFEYFEVKGE